MGYLSELQLAGHFQILIYFFENQVDGYCLSCSFVGYSFYIVDRHLNEGCEQIEGIARNPEYVGFLDQWASKNAIGKGYHFVSGMHGDIFGAFPDREGTVEIEVPASS